MRRVARVESAIENPETGQITASIEMDDGFMQTVVVPSWATKAQIIEEAERLANKVDPSRPRPDLED